MIKMSVGTLLSTAVTLGALCASTPSLAAVRDAEHTFAPLDTLLNQAATLQQGPLARAHRQTPIAQDTPADPDSLYVHYAASDLDQLATPDDRSYDARNQLFVSGGEYRLSPQWTAGARLGHIDQTLSFSDSDDALNAYAHNADVLKNDELRHEANLVNLYAQWFKNGFSTGALIGYADGEVESLRTPIEGLERIQATTDTQQTLASVWGRYAFQKDGWVYGPFSRWDISRSNIDDIIERGNNYTARISGRETNSSIFSMGVHGAYIFGVSNGQVTPYFTLATRKQLREKRESITSDIQINIMDTTVGFFGTQDVLPQDERWHELTCGLTIQLDKRLLVTAEAEKTLDLYQLDQQALLIRADWIFP